MLLSRLGSDYQKNTPVSNSEKSGSDRYKSSAREQFGVTKTSAPPANNTAASSTASSLKSLFQSAPSGLFTRNTASATISGSGAVGSYQRNNDYYNQNNSSSQRSISSSRGLLSSGNSLSSGLGSSMTSASNSLFGFSGSNTSSQAQNGINQYRLIGGQGSNSGGLLGKSSSLLQKSASGLGGSFNLFG